MKKKHKSKNNIRLSLPTPSLPLFYYGRFYDLILLIARIAALILNVLTE